MMWLEKMADGGKNDLGAATGRRIRLADVAAAAGVSVCTVSEALRGEVRVAVATRERITRLARDMGYERDAAAALLVGRRMRGRAADRVKVGVIGEIASIARLKRLGRGYEYVELKFPSLKRLKQSLNGWWHQGIAGLIISLRGGHGERSYVDQALADGITFSQFCVVSIGPSRFSCVRDSPIRMMSEALDHVVQKGYRRIAVLLGQTDQLVDDQARLGAVLVFRESMSEGIELAWRPVRLQPLVLETETREWLQRWRPDCVVSFPGGYYFTLAAAGFSMPQDFGFCGLPVMHQMAEENHVAGMETHQEEFDVAVIELMEQLLRLGLRGVPEHPLVRVLTLTWRDGATLPPR